MAGKLSGSAIQSGTITVTQLSGSFNDTTNAAYAQANSAYGQANAARSDANTTFATVNSTFGTINTNYQAAYAAANNSNLKAGGLVSGTLNVTQDLIVGGNIYLEGNTTYINVATYSVEDSLIYMSSNNKLTDSVDIGIMGGKNTSGTYSHTGLARDATDAKWKLFDGLAEEGHVGNVVDFANTYLATLVANVEANTLTVVNGVTGNVNFDSGTLFVDSVGNEVGIGTTNPTVKLDVVGAGKFTDNNVYGSSGAQLRVIKDAASTPAAITIFGYNNLSLNQSAAALEFDLQAQGTGGQTAAAIHALNADSGEKSAHIAFYTTTDSTSIEAGSAATERVRITSAGNVGLGVTDPSVGLVIADKTANDGTDFIGLFYKGTAGNHESGINWYDFRGQINAKIVNVLQSDGAGSPGAHLDLRTSDRSTGNLTTVIRLTETANVGIGTTNPQGKLDIRSSGLDTNVLTIYGTTNNAKMFDFRDDNAAGTAAMFRMYNRDGAETLRLFPGTNSIHHSWILPQGNVGIGTTNPSGKFHTQATNSGIYFDLSSAYAPKIIASGALSDLQLEAVGNGGNIISKINGAASYFMWFNGATETMRLNGSGNLGIGTTNPSGKLHVKAASGFAELYVQGASSTSGMYLFDNNTEAGMWKVDSGYLAFGTVNTERMRVTSSGAIGIGTTSPNSNTKLDVLGALGFQRVNTTLTSGNDASGLIYVRQNGNSAGTEEELRYLARNHRFFDHLGQTLLSISSEGKIGIGTTNPSIKLDVWSGSGDYIAQFRRTDWQGGGTPRIAIGKSLAVTGYIQSDIVEYVNDTAYIALFYKSGLSTYSEGLRVHNNGNVGIGTTSPDGALHVKSSTNKTIKLDATLADGTSSFTALSIARNGTDKFRIFQYGDDRGLLVYSDAGSTSSIFLANTGNVGIGTTSLTKKFHVYNGTTVVHGETSGSSTISQNTHAIVIAPYPQRTGTNGLYFPGIAFNHLYSYSGTTYDSASHGWIGLRLVDTPGSEYSSLVFATKPGTGTTGSGNDIPIERMCITYDGKVGIGTKTPTTELFLKEGSFHLERDGSAGSPGSWPTIPPLRILSWAGDGPSSDTSIGMLSLDAGRVNTTDTYAGNAYFIRASADDGVCFWVKVTGAAYVRGSLSKGSGSFRIDHPLPEKSNTHHLVHSFIEGPQADLIYRGKVQLVDGAATVNIDTASGMTEGTFVALCRDVQCFTTNETSWDAVRGSVSENILTIECQNTSSNATISWIVIGERQDKHMYETEWTDENGRVIVEPEKEIITNQE